MHPRLLVSVDHRRRFAMPVPPIQPHPVFSPSIRHSVAVGVGIDMLMVRFSRVVCECYPIHIAAIVLVADGAIVVHVLY